MKRGMALGIGGLLLAALMILAASPAAAQEAVRSLQEMIDSNRDALSGCPAGPYGDHRVLLNQNGSVDSYDSSVAPYNPNNPGDHAVVGSNCDPNDATAGVKLEENSTVLGHIEVTAADKIDLAANCTVTHEELNLDNAPSWELKPIDQPAWYTVAGGSPQGTIIGQYGTKPGTYNISNHVFQAGNAAELTFAPGQYHFDHFELRQNVKFNVGTGAGIVEIYVSGSITFENNSELLPEIALVDDATRLRIYYSGTNTVDLSNNVTFYGFLYAPNALIEVKNNDQIYGNLVGKDVKIWNNGAVHYDEALGQQDFSSILGPPLPPPLRLTWRETVFE